MRHWLDFLIPPRADFLEVAGRRIPLVFARHPRARRYLLRVRSDGSARVTIPRGGSLAEGRRFAGRNLVWVAEQLQRLPLVGSAPREWRLGAEILFRGELRRIVSVSDGAPAIHLGEETFPVSDVTANLRPLIETHLQWLAANELPPRVMELAVTHGLVVRRVTVRSQRTRWGSCSRRGTISLNWRLIQTPPFVCDYILLHELMHLREMNHSARFWRHVENACPDYRDAEHWLKQHSKLLRP